MKTLTSLLMTLLLSLHLIACEGGAGAGKATDEDVEGNGDIAENGIQSIDTSDLPEAGLKVFEDNCASCHSLDEMIEERVDKKEIEDAMKKEDEHEDIDLSKGDLSDLEDLIEAAEKALDDDKDKDKKDKDKKGK